MTETNRPVSEILSDAPAAPPAPAVPWGQRLAELVGSQSAAPLLLGLIIVVGAALRLYGINWDSSKHLHPDERFLTSVAADIKWPTTLDSYFDPKANPLSPYSLQNMGLYVYGTLPLWLVKAVAILLGRDNYDAIAIVGRAISALFDVGTIAVIYLIGRRLYGQAVGLLGAALLALSVLDIQLSHFFTVDTFANLFVVLVVLFALRVCDEGTWADYAAVGLLLGAGMASKLSVVTLVAPVLLAAGWDFARRVRSNGEPPVLALERTGARLLLAGALTALTFRVLQPISFQGPQFWNFTLYQDWLDDVTEQSKILAGEYDAPPWHQWTNRPALLFPLQNMLLWGMGLPLGLAAWAGWALGAFQLFWRRRWAHLLPVVYVGVTFVYHGALWVKFMRYFLPIYPFLALFAAFLLVAAYRQIRAALARRQPAPAPAWRPAAVAALPAAFVLLGTLAWAVAFSAIYGRTHPRVEASRWMIANFPAGTVLANEHWDDWLPLGIDGVDPYGQKLVTGVEMNNYDDDSPEKLDRMVDNLTKADYVILSSNRLYESIPRLPMRYPMTTRYYALLFEGQLGFTRVADFTSYPTLLGVSIPDQSAEESFTVYDHPRVQVFRKQPGFSPEKVRALLSEGVDFSAVVHLTPKQATAAPTLLQLSRAESQRYSDVEARLRPAPWAGAAAAAPLLLWALALTAAGLAALPLTMLALARLRDRGFALARVVGLLATAWLAWLMGSARLLPFSWWSVAIALLAVAAVSWGAAWPRRAELLAFARERRGALLAEEGLFWACFLAMAAVRFMNPDLWHPGLGGEKPMDTAYLNAVVASPFFPPYDPWYAGGYINYYYFGFVLVASLVHLSGVAVTTAYNLAVPTLFALTAAGACSAAGSLAFGRGADEAGRGGRLSGLLRGRRAWLAAGVAGALFVTTAGNLGQVQLFWDGLQKLSSIPAAAPQAAPARPEDFGLATIVGPVGDKARDLLAPAPRALDGLMQMVFNGRSLDFRQEWWYWNATRVIPPGDGEAGPINEFPFFTFLFADLHAHMMALPLTVLAIAICVSLVRGAEPEPLAPAPAAPEPVAEAAEEAEGEGEKRPRPGWLEAALRLARRVDSGEAALLALAALTVGALWPTNTWDFPTYALLTGAALALRAYARSGGKIDPPTIWAAGWRWAAVVVAGFALYRPFHASSASAYFGAEQWKGSHTPLWAYLIAHGFFLFVLVSWMASELLYGRNLSGPARRLAMAIRHRRRGERLARLTARLVRPGPAHSLAVALAPLGAALLAALVLAGHPVEALALAVAGLAGLLFFRPRPEPRRQLALLMVAAGALLTAVVEVVVLKGDISRMNTVFKFYLQVWVLWATASAAALPDLAERLRPAPAARPARAQASGAWGARWWQAFTLLLGGCLLYTVTATPARIHDRFEGVTADTLDGSAYMRDAVYTDQGQPIALDYDLQAIDWMRAQIPGRPTIVEANTPLYRWGSRVSIYTGMPTVIGWDWHQKQQRAILPGDYIDRRISDVKAIYADPNPDVARRLLQQYGVQYIYLGKLEQLYYPGDGLAKFEQQNGQLWDKVYENPEVRIYRVRQP